MAKWQSLVENQLNDHGVVTAVLVLAETTAVKGDQSSTNIQQKVTSLREKNYASYITH